MEKAGRNRSLPDYPHRIRSREQRWSDFERSVALVKSSDFSPQEQEERIRRLKSAHLGVAFTAEGNEYILSPVNTLSNTLTEEAPKPQKRPRFGRAKTIFHG